MIKRGGIRNKPNAKINHHLVSQRNAIDLRGQRNRLQSIHHNAMQRPDHSVGS